MPRRDSSSHSRPVALILDDDPAVRELVGEALELEGFDTLLCESQEEMETHLNGTPVDMFILDVMLPDGNGMKIARDLRRTTDAGIILLTGRAEELDQVLGLELGADDYVTKPFRIREFRARVNAVYRRVAARKESAGAAQQEGEDKTLTVPGLVISPLSRTVHRDTGERVPLTTAEFDVLIVLASNPNRVLTRDRIMDEVRGPNWTAYDRAVDGLVSRLRSKLYPGKDAHERIKTVRGVGYLLSN